MTVDTSHTAVPTEAQVDAAARALHEHMGLHPEVPWDRLPVIAQHAFRERVLPIATAVVRA